MVGPALKQSQHDVRLRVGQVRREEEGRKESVVWSWDGGERGRGERKHPERDDLGNA